MSDTVNFQELPCGEDGYVVAIATLDNSTSLNALTHNMIVLLKQQLEKWHQDERVVCVVLDGAGEKAFCAGGDVRAMHTMMKTEPADVVKAYCEQFFRVEYECDYLIHSYCKPIIGWGDGIVMGGGMGLFMGTSHKVVTPASRLAMPEISIGLFPDVGATYFLNQLEDRLGLFLGLTGVMFNATDAMDIHMADHLVVPDAKEKFINQLQETDWNCVEDSYEFISECLDKLAAKDKSNLPAPQLKPRLNEICAACNATDIGTVFTNIMALPGNEKWLAAAKHNLTGGSPITAHICFRQINDYSHLSLADCFRLELILGVRSATLGEFEEGVRSRLVDKDGAPYWKYPNINSVDKAVIDELFTSLWREQEHPLFQLGRV
ncbi:enoyl-CoA hydratase/isomerase family protein [Vibrio mediterranei]|uniref:3-hydroxyisobutyryl-CoA hydrolase n=1 Tax=Vibrio mediterranei TaxID=689 RepID=A0ABX5DG27_9VIBR|nr:enoyl-CoA hydratase/isomerase family protein [Vibrio mediterranei]PCD88014.1 enoyl-CoA hydratase [Vibrio mediterranei]PRQ67787.1 enoyl-CoA hydratase [Vibrio mediterranei]